jgi:DNA-binding response OmpR family regulator
LAEIHSVSDLDTALFPLPSVIMKSDDLTNLEQELERRGLAPSVRAAMRNAKIAVVDDHVDDLEGMLDGLRREGFSNLVKIPELESVNELLSAGYDLVILDLVGVARAVTEADGVGVLAAIKRASPATAVLVVSGNAISPALAADLRQADLIRTKPVLPGDLAADAETLLRVRTDQYWAGFAILKELNRLEPELRERLGWKARIALWWNSMRLARQLANQDPGVIQRLIKISDAVSRLGAIAVRITSVTNAIR